MSVTVTPEMRRRLGNLQRHWQAKCDAAADAAALALVCFDRARAAARRAERDGSNPQAMYDLAQLLAAWAERMEHAEALRHSGHRHRA